MDSKFSAPPKFAADGQRDFEVVEGESVTLDCPVKAHPFPQITWLHGTEQIDLDKVRFSNDNKVWILL